MHTHLFYVYVNDSRILRFMLITAALFKTFLQYLQQGTHCMCHSLSRFHLFMICSSFWLYEYNVSRVKLSVLLTAPLASNRVPTAATAHIFTYCIGPLVSVFKRIDWINYTMDERWVLQGMSVIYM